MFFKDTATSTNITAATPERVYKLAKIVERRENINKLDLREEIEPSYSYSASNNYFSPILLAAIDLGIVVDADGIIRLATNKENLKTIFDFRRYINMNIDKYKNGIFYQITSVILDLDLQVFEKIKNVQDLADITNKEKKLSLKPDEIRAWRFWASFLGFGYLDDMFLLPNPNIYLKDLISGSRLEKKKQYLIEEFIKEIEPGVNILLGKERLNRTLNYAFTSAIQTLVDLGIIKVERIGDFEVWNLKKGISSLNVITHITVLK